jgi:hypothetical protein
LNPIAKLRTNWRTVLLGLGAGLFSSGLCLLAYQIDEYHRLLREAQARAAMPFRIGCAFGRSPYWWIDVAAIHIFLYVVATLVIYRFLSKRETSVFMLWQYIGMSVIAGWFLLMVIEMIPRLLDGWPFHIFSPVSPAGGKVTAIAFAASVIYGTAIHLFTQRRALK